MMKFHKDSINLRSSSYTWHASGTNGEYYLTTSTGANPGLLMPNDLIINGSHVKTPLLPDGGVWQANHTYPAGSFIYPNGSYYSLANYGFISANAFVYYTANGGISGATHPTWSTTNNATCNDNGITWLAVGSNGNKLYRFTLSGMRLGLLQPGTWTYGDNDSLGFSTIYIKLTGGSNPQSQADGYIVYENGFWAQGDSGTFQQGQQGGLGPKLIDIEAGFVSDTAWVNGNLACSDWEQVQSVYGGCLQIFDFWPGDSSVGSSCAGIQAMNTITPGTLRSNPTCYALDTQTFAPPSGCGPFINSVYDQWFGIEIATKLSSAAGVADGWYEIWIYDSSGSVLSGYPHLYNNIVTKNIDVDMKWNRVRLGGNRAPGSYELANILSWENRIYIDDIIVNGSQIGPAYFALFSGQQIDDGGSSSSGSFVSGSFSGYVQ
jgi:hypothetical protein